MNKVIAIACGLLFGLACAATARAQAPANTIEGFEVTQQSGKTIVRITTKEALRSVPPNFAVANPARWRLPVKKSKCRRFPDSAPAVRLRLEWLRLPGRSRR